MFVYLLRSNQDPNRRYVGLTTNLSRRLNEHNVGKSKHTAKYAPWEIIVALWFQDEEKAKIFETYLKKGSGWAFANRHFW